MKRVILAIFTLFSLGICGVGILLAAAYQGNHKLQMPVFKAIAEEDTDGFLALCDPRLRDEIDPPLLLSWMSAMNESLGQCRFEPVGAFNINVEKTPGETITKSSGGIQFEKGTASSKLVFLNNKIIQFSIDSDRLPGDWFNGPAETSFYQQHSEVVIRALLDRRLDELKVMLHPALIEAAPDSKLNEICDLGDGWAGNVTSVTATEANFHRHANEQLVVDLTVTSDKGVVDATVTFTFDGLKGHVTAFNVQPAE